MPDTWLNHIEATFNLHYALGQKCQCHYASWFLVLIDKWLYSTHKNQNIFLIICSFSMSSSWTTGNHPRALWIFSCYLYECVWSLSSWGSWRHCSLIIEANLYILWCAFVPARLSQFLAWAVQLTQFVVVLWSHDQCDLVLREQFVIHSWVWPVGAWSHGVNSVLSDTE